MSHLNGHIGAAVKSQIVQGLSRVTVLIGTPCVLALLGWLISNTHDLQNRMTVMETSIKGQIELRIVAEGMQNRQLEIHDVRLNAVFERIYENNLRIDRLERPPFK